MRIFVQMSVGGFKVFDVAAFAHECDQGRFALIREIADTQQGIKDSQTHIIRNNMHGMRLETMRLFSSPDVSLLLHDDWFNDEPVRCLFVAQAGLTKDTFQRQCDVSYCVMGQNEQENEQVNSLAYAIAVLRDETVLNQLSALLHTSTIDDRSVLLFETAKWNALLEVVNSQDISDVQPLCSDIVQGDLQVAVIHDNLNGRQVYKNQPGLFNDSQYWVLHEHELPIVRHYDLISRQPVFFAPQKKPNEKTSHDDLRDFLKELRDLIKKYSR